MGSHLIQKLASRGNRIIALSRSGKSIAGAEGFSCDILDVVELENAMKGVDKVYHCAAVVSFDGEEKQELFNTNIQGTANVVNECIDAGVKKLVYVSSVAALGHQPGQKPLTEENEFTGKGSVYGKTKHFAEMEVWRAGCEGLNIAIVNPSIILGAGDWNSGSTQLFKSAYEEFPYYTEGIHGFVDVNDVAEAMIRLMESGISNQRFILNAVNISFKELFTKIALAMGKKPPHKKVNRFMAELVWRLSYLSAKFSGKKPLLTKETARSAQESVYYSNEKILKALPGFSFTPFDDTINRIAGELKKRYSL